MKLALILWLAHILPQPVADPMCLATTVYLEARGQTVIGQRAIAEVALRRRDSGIWGSSVCSVVTAPGQFAMATLSPNQRLIEPAAGLLALRIAIDTAWDWSQPRGKRHEVVPGANSFALSSVDAGNGHVVKRIGSHTFYRSPSLAAR
ncbi:MAG: cell wall hydrolase [Proteobacteria bacterium]|nr:cell wall hydrolase [Pseudomonadota bacterium]